LFEGDFEVAMGTVKWFNATKGYGFIKPDGGGPDVFVHVSAVERAGYTALAEGAKISYELVTTRNGKTAAEKLRIG
jgi:cold shock protein